MPPFLAYVILLLAIIGCIGVGYLITRLGSRNCNLVICEQHGKYISQAMNTTLDPCDDFYEYVCSNFDPDEQSIQGMIQESSYRIVAQYLKPPIDYNVDGKISQVAKLVFRPCIKEAILEKQGLSPLERIVDSIGSMPFLNPDWQKEKDSTFSLMKADILMFKKGIPSSFFDLKNSMFPKEQHIEFSIPAFLIQSFIPNPNDWVKFSEVFLNHWNKLKQSNKTLTRRDKQDILDAAKFKSALMNLIRYKKNCSRASYRFISQNYLTNLTKGIAVGAYGQQKKDWISSWINERALTNAILFQNPVIFIGEFEAYFKGVLSLLNDKKYTVRVISNFLGIQSLISFYPLMPKKFREIVEKYLLAKRHETSITMYRIANDRELLCAKTIHDVIVTVLSSQYLSDYPIPIKEQTRKLYNIQLSKIMSVIKELVVNMNWIHDNDKSEMIDTLKNITYNVPLPESVFNDMQDKMGFESIYMRYCSNENSALETYLSLKKAYLETLIIVKNQWSIYYMDPEYDAFGHELYYDSLRHAIVAPLPFATYPSFASQWPKHTNFAGLGVWIAQQIFRLVLGHNIQGFFPDELTSSDDEQPAEEDFSFPTESVWSNGTDLQYRARRLCMFNEYNAFLQQYHAKINDPNCLEDSVAYAGAVQAAYYAYRAYTRNRFFFEAKIPHLKEFNVDQYFFIKYASNFCDNRDTKFNVTMESSVFIPNHFTVLATLQNFPKFAEVFKCKPGSPMNPTTKCLMWRN